MIPRTLELYMFTVFAYRDRFVGLMRNYARSPLMIGEHGPHIAYEWWVSHDGRRWQRPAREMHVGVFTPPAHLLSLTAACASSSTTRCGATARRSTA